MDKMIENVKVKVGISWNMQLKDGTPSSCIPFLQQVIYRLLSKEFRDCFLTNDGRNVTFPELPGWEFHKDSYGTVGAHYLDGNNGASVNGEDYWVPVITYWNWSRSDAIPTLEIGGFVRHKSGECGYCGDDIQGEMVCPTCGAS